MSAPWPPAGWEIASTDKPCTGCGHCCQQLPCGLAGDHRPCNALVHHEGKYRCSLVERETPDAREQLLIGLGCGATIVPSILRKRLR